MRDTKATMKTVSKAEAQAQFEQLLREVASGRTSLTIEEDGEPVAIVLPFDQDARRRAARERVMATISEMQATASVSPEEAEELAQEAVAAARAASNHR